MGTKKNPGKFDCYDSAEPDEPLFVLLGRDDLAPFLVQIWAMMRAGNRHEARRTFQELIVGPQSAVYVLKPDAEKALEATQCAYSMLEYRDKNKT